MLHGVSCCLVYSGVHARYTDAFYVNNVGDSVQRHAEYLVEGAASGDTGCELVTGQSCGNSCYGHTRENVCMAVDLLLCRSLFVALDTARIGRGFMFHLQLW